jgi:hypothetical protein
VCEGRLLEFRRKIGFFSSKRLPLGVRLRILGILGIRKKQEKRHLSSGSEQRILLEKEYNRGFRQIKKFKVLG